MDTSRINQNVKATTPWNFQQLYTASDYDGYKKRSKQKLKNVMKCNWISQTRYQVFITKERADMGQYDVKDHPLPDLTTFLKTVIEMDITITETS